MIIEAYGDEKISDDEAFKILRTFKRMWITIALIMLTIFILIL